MLHNVLQRHSYRLQSAKLFWYQCNHRRTLPQMNSQTWVGLGKYTPQQANKHVYLDLAE